MNEVKPWRPAVHIALPGDGEGGFLLLKPAWGLLGPGLHFSAEMKTSRLSLRASMAR